MREVFLILIVAVHAFGLSASSLAQEGGPTPARPEAQEESIEAGEVTVDLDDRPPDAEIQERIEAVLGATERFQGLRVEVIDGVVFLSGSVAREPTRALASELSRRTEGVAAVVNNLTLIEPPLWSLEPAAAELRALFREFVRVMPLLLIAGVIVAAAWLVARGASRLGSRAVSGRTESTLLQSVASKAVFLLVLLVGVYMALRVSGLTRVALTVVSGTGLIGLVIGFAFRDIAENFLASVLLSIQRPFRLGDVIEVDGHLGVVRKVTSRGTLLIDFDGNHIQIANATVYKNTIKNFSANPLMRIWFEVGIGYDDAIADAQRVILESLGGHPAVLKEPEPLVLVEALGASTVKLRVYAWIDGAEHSVLKMKSSLIRRVVNALTDAGVSMPDEAREVIFPQGVPVTMSERPAEPARGAAAEGAPAPARTRRASEQDAALVVKAEGDLTTETHELKRQAERARDPEGGANVLN